MNSLLTVHYYQSGKDYKSQSYKMAVYKPNSMARLYEALEINFNFENRFLFFNEKICFIWMDFKNLFFQLEYLSTVYSSGAVLKYK